MMQDVNAIGFLIFLISPFFLWPLALAIALIIDTFDVHTRDDESR